MQNPLGILLAPKKKSGKILSAEFTDKEMAVIKAMMRLYGWNNSKLLRKCVMIGCISLLVEDILNNPRNPLAKVLEPVAKRIFDDETLQRVESEIQKEGTKLDPLTIAGAKKQFAILQHSLRFFKEHPKRGRPRKLGTPKRGDPKTLEVIMLLHAGLIRSARKAAQLGSEVASPAYCLLLAFSETPSASLSRQAGILAIQFSGFVSCSPEV